MQPVSRGLSGVHEKARAGRNGQSIQRRRGLLSWIMKKRPPFSATAEEISGLSVVQRAFYYAAPLALPVLFAAIPTLYHYSNNVEKLTLLNLSRMLTFNAVVAVAVYAALVGIFRFHPVKAANAAFVFLIFFNIYGAAYRYLLHADVIRVRHYTLLPLTIMLAVYSILFIAQLEHPVLARVWKALLQGVCLLVVFNLIQILPAEAKRWGHGRAAASLAAQAESTAFEGLPDIYYIVLDEFAGFQAMREYWQYEEIDEFVSFLKDRGFFVAEASHASSTDTLHQMATRLNYQEYPLGEQYIQMYFDDISDNRAMRYLESRGYTTVVIDERKMGYPSARPIHADYSYEYGSSAIPQGDGGAYGFYFDEFGELVMDNTILYIFSAKYKKNQPLVSQHSNMIYFTVDNIADNKIPSPKSVYVHLLLPHAPFMFGQNGEIRDSQYFTNWNYYLDNYIFSIRIAEAMIDRILSETDPGNPPVIIIQSDHGARNHLTHREGSAVLPDYPEEFKTLILYALLLPGYDYSNLPQDINPINTFPIVFNYLFDTNIPLVDSAPSVHRSIVHEAVDSSLLESYLSTK